MKKSTHSKLKNAGILFELLSRQITADVLSGVEPSIAHKILMESFKVGTKLHEEFRLYQMLIEHTTKSEIKAHYLIDAVCGAYKKIDLRSLSREKFNLIKQIKEAYDIDKFFSTRLPQYKIYASIYRILESSRSVIDPTETLSSRFAIVEHLTTTKQRIKEDLSSSVEKEFLNLDMDTRILAYRSLLDKFNTKYSGLSSAQKELLREYINNISNTHDLSIIAKRQAQQLVTETTALIPNRSQIEQVKLQELLKLLDKYRTIKVIKEQHILQLLLFHELLKELK